VQLINGYKGRHYSVIDDDVINFIVLCRSIVSTNMISSTAVSNKTAAILFRATLFSIMTINQQITFVYSYQQRTVRNDRCVTHTALSVTGSRFWSATARADIPLMIVIILFNVEFVLTADANVIVRRAKLHNDSSCDVSQDGRLLCTFIQNSRGFNGEVALGVFSLQPHNRGQCLYTKSFGNFYPSLSFFVMW